MLPAVYSTRWWILPGKEARTHGEIPSLAIVVEALCSQAPLIV